MSSGSVAANPPTDSACGHITKFRPSKQPVLVKTIFSWIKTKQVHKIVLIVVRGYFSEFLVFLFYFILFVFVFF